MRDFSTKQIFAGLSLGNQSVNETGVAVINKNSEIVTLDKLFTVDDIIYFLENMPGKSDALILVSMADTATLLNQKWKVYSKRYQLVAANTLIKNVDNWMERFSTRGCEAFLKLKEDGYDIYRYDISDARMKLGVNSISKSRSPSDCKFLQNTFKNDLGYKTLPSNMLPVCQLEALAGATLALRIAQGKTSRKLFEYCGLDVLSI